MSFDPEAFNNTDATTGSDSQPPDIGTYEVVLHDATAFQAKSGKDIILLELQVASGEAAGHAWTEIFGFGSEGAYKATKATCQRLGMSLDGVANLEDFGERLKLLIGNWYVVDVVASRNPAYPKNSVFFKDGGPITAGAASDVPADTSGFQTASAGASGNDDSDIPFAFEPQPAWAQLKGETWGPR